MTDENSTPKVEQDDAKTEQVKESKAEEKTEDAQIETHPETLAQVVADRLSNKAKELEEVEKRVDKKLADFKKFISDTEIKGKSLAGVAVEKTVEEKAKEAANSLLKGTGLSL